MTAYEKPAFEKGKTRVFGHSVLRIEDVPLVTGRGRYIADLNFPRQLHMRIVRSGLAHGSITAINVDAARAVDGVEAIWTHADIGDLPPIDFRDPAAEVLKPYRQPLLAVDRVRYVGEPVAAVFAESAAIAEDAAELVALDLSELPPQLDTIDPAPEFTLASVWKRWCCGRPMATSRRRSAVRTALSRRSCASAVTPACRWNVGVPLVVMTAPMTSLSFGERRRCRIATVMRWRVSSIARHRPCNFTNVTSAAASAFAVNSIPRTSWSALPVGGSADR